MKSSQLLVTWTCDRCRVTADTLHPMSEPSRYPEGWALVSVGAGSSYGTKSDLCPSCFAQVLAIIAEDRP